MRQGDQKADCGPDGGPDHGSAGADKDPASGSGGPRTERASTSRFWSRPRKSGYVRVRVDGNLYELSEEIKLEKNKKHNIEIVVDRLVVKPGIEKRLTDSMENVLKLADGLADGGCDRTESTMHVQPELFLPGLRHQHR